MLDILIAIPIVLLILRGWKHGIVREAATLVGIIAGIWASVHLSQGVAEWLDLGGEWAVIAAFFVCFVGALAITYLVGRMIEKGLKDANLSLLNKIGGAATGLVKATCIVAVLLTNIVNLDSKEVLIKTSAKEDSKLYSPMIATGNWFTASLKHHVADNKGLILGS